MAKVTIIPRNVRKPYKVLGRIIGTATDWDPGDVLEMQLYDFQPFPGVNLPAADCLLIDFEAGQAHTFRENGEIESTFDIIAILANVPSV